MKILIKGSIFEPDKFKNANGAEYHGYIAKQKVMFERNFNSDYEAYQQAFIATCKALGAALVQAGHEIIVGVPHWHQFREGRSVESYVLQGASAGAISRNHKVIFYTPQDLEPPDSTIDVIDSIQNFKELPNITIEQRYLGRGHWSAGMIGDMREADAVILIGGGNGAASIGYAAFSFGKPVIPITWFGGAAFDISENVVFNHWLNNANSYKLNAQEIACTQNHWQTDPENAENKSTAKEVVKLTNKLVTRARLLQSNAIRVVKLTTALLVAFMFLWLVFFLQGTQFLQLPNETVFFFLLFIASIVGTGLRTLVSYSSKQTSTPTFLHLGIDIAVGLGLALGFALFYLIGSISFTGNVVLLNELARPEFTNIAVSMSLLGLAAGFLLPIEKLERQLEVSISPQEDTTNLADPPTPIQQLEIAQETTS